MDQDFTQASGFDDQMVKERQESYIKTCNEEFALIRKLAERLTRYKCDFMSDLEVRKAVKTAPFLEYLITAEKDEVQVTGTNIPASYTLVDISKEMEKSEMLLTQLKLIAVEKGVNISDITQKSHELTQMQMTGFDY